MAVHTLENLLPNELRHSQQVSKPVLTVLNNLTFLLSCLMCRVLVDIPVCLVRTLMRSSPMTVAVTWRSSPRPHYSISVYAIINPSPKTTDTHLCPAGGDKGAPQDFICSTGDTPPSLEAKYRCEGCLS